MMVISFLVIPLAPPHGSVHVNCDRNVIAGSRLESSICRH